MTDTLDLARATLLTPAGLTDADLDRTFATLLDHQVDAGDLYFQLSRGESWTLEDGSVKHASRGVSQGVGVRALSGDQTGFAHSDEVSIEALLEAAHTARTIARSGGRGRSVGRQSETHRALYPATGSDRNAGRRAQSRSTRAA